MSDRYERSYYEIALTNNQVLSALAVLLLCLLASFVAGMWVAREAVGSSPMQVAAAEDGDGLVEQESEGRFEFFRRLGQGRADGDGAQNDEGASAGGSNQEAGGATGDRAAARQSGPAESGRAARPQEPPPSVRGSGEAETRIARTVSPVERAVDRPTLRDEQPDRNRAARTRGSDRPTGSVTPAEQPQSDRSPVQEPAQVAQAQPPRPEPERRSTPPAAQPARPSVAPTLAADRAPDRRLSEMLVVQVLSSSDQEQAGKVVVQLKDSGYRAFLSPAQVEGRTMYRVRVGPYADRAQAERASETIKREFRLNTWITARS